MKTIKVNEKEYVLEFSFEAAERKEVVQDMFNILSGTYIIKNASKGKSAGAAMFNGVTEMVADIPRIAREAFFAGLLENHNLSSAEAKEAMKSYMKENNLTYNDLFEEMKICMEDDGFFDLAGITKMIQTMNQTIENVKPGKDSKKKEN